MSLKVPSSLVSVDWLSNNLEAQNLIVLDATITKVASKSKFKNEKVSIKNAIFFDIKNQFSDKTSRFPNTVLDVTSFEKEAQNLGINNNSCIVVYDDYGIYSSPRVWWLFQLMGFTNIAVLDGGLLKWKEQNNPTEKPRENLLKEGNFKADYKPNKIVFTKDVLENIKSKEYVVIDARSKGRFYATEPEPRKEIKGGRIPNSLSLPYSEIIENDIFKSKEDLKKIYKNLNPDNQPIIFSCGSGITASVLALGAAVANFNDTAVYDGSWTEWGSTENLPIEK